MSEETAVSAAVPVDDVMYPRRGFVRFARTIFLISWTNIGWCIGNIAWELFSLDRSQQIDIFTSLRRMFIPGLLSTQDLPKWSIISAIVLFVSLVVCSIWAVFDVRNERIVTRHVANGNAKRVHEYFWLLGLPLGLILGSVSFLAHLDFSSIATTLDSIELCIVTLLVFLVLSFVVYMLAVQTIRLLNRDVGILPPMSPTSEGMAGQQEATTPAFPALPSLQPPDPAPEGLASWNVYWRMMGQDWRTEQEINLDRQRALKQRLTPHSGVLPFKDTSLTRADVEWLLAHHDDGLGFIGPVDWSDPDQQKRTGLDLRGANLSEVDLSQLPLAAAHLEEADLSFSKLEHADLRAARLEGSLLNTSMLTESNMFQAHLEWATLDRAHLRKATLVESHLEGAVLTKAHLEDADLTDAHLEGKMVDTSHLRYLRSLDDEFPEELPATDLREAYFSDGTILSGSIWGNGKYGVSLADVHWGGVNVDAIDWRLVGMLGEEYEIRDRTDTEDTDHQETSKQSARISKQRLLRPYREAIRANHQLAVMLHAKGLSEESARFFSRAETLQGNVYWYQRKFGLWAISLLLSILTGYGYRPIYLLRWYVMVVYGFTAFYFAYAEITGPPVSQFEAFLLSAVSFHRLGLFSLNALPTGGVGAIAVIIEGLLGIIIETALVAVLVQRLIRK